MAQIRFLGPFSISVASFRPFQAGGHVPFSFSFSPDFCVGCGYALPASTPQNLLPLPLAPFLFGSYRPISRLRLQGLCRSLLLLLACTYACISHKRNTGRMVFKTMAPLPSSQLFFRIGQGTTSPGDFPCHQGRPCPPFPL